MLPQNQTNLKRSYSTVTFTVAVTVLTTCNRTIRLTYLKIRVFIPITLRSVVCQLSLANPGLEVRSYGNAVLLNPPNSYISMLRFSAIFPALLLLNSDFSVNSSRIAIEPLVQNFSLHF